jgi:hypothetical protein
VKKGTWGYIVKKIYSLKIREIFPRPKKGHISQQIFFPSPQNWKVGLVSLQVLISFPIKIGESLKQRKRGLGAIFFKLPSI